MLEKRELQQIVTFEKQETVNVQQFPVKNDNSLDKSIKYFRAARLFSPDNFTSRFFFLSFTASSHVPVLQLGNKFSHWNPFQKQNHNNNNEQSFKTGPVCVSVWEKKRFSA